MVQKTIYYESEYIFETWKNNLLFALGKDMTGEYYMNSLMNYVLPFLHNQEYKFIGV